MKAILVQVFLCVLFLEKKLCSAHCLCYTFHDTKLRWLESKATCKIRNGTLVSMETEDEWDFITNEILKINSTANPMNEWYIGLTIASKELNKYYKLEDKRKANWTWTSGKRLTIYNKWQPVEPNNYQKDQDMYCTAMAKNYPAGKHGFVKDVLCGSRYPYICEYDAGTRVSPSLNPVCWSNLSTKTRLTSCPEVVPPTTGKIPEETTRTTQVNNIKPTTIIPTTPMSSQPTVPTVVTTVKASSDTLRQTKKPSYVLIIVIVLAVLVIVLIVLFIAVCCRLKKKKGKSSFKERSPLTAQTSISSRQFSTKLGEPSHTVPEQIIYAEVNNKTTSHPTTTYDNAQEYQDPVDSLPSSPTQPDMYSTINEGNEEQNLYREPQTETDENAVASNAYEAIANNGPNAGAAAMYAVVDKSKKTKKKAGDAMATDNNNLQEEAKVQYPNDASAQQSSPEVTAVYAAVDKSKKSKGKKAGVAIATENHDLQNEGKSEIHNDTSAQQGSTGVTAVYAAVDKSKKSKGKKAGVSMTTTSIVDQNEANDYQNNVPSDENPPEVPEHYEALEDKPKEMKEGKAGVDVPAENYDQTEAYANNEILNLYAEVDDSMKRNKEM